MENPYTINEFSEKRYYQGWINWSFRQYFYTQEGLGSVGQFRTIAYFLIGFGLIFNIEQTNYKLLGLIGLAVVPVLWILGYVMVTRGNKSLEYFKVKELSTFGKYGVEMQERNLNQQDEIIKLLTEIKNK
mgnify:FL=1